MPSKASVDIDGECSGEVNSDRSETSLECVEVVSSGFKVREGELRHSRSSTGRSTLTPLCGKCSSERLKMKMMQNGNWDSFAEIEFLFLFFNLTNGFGWGQDIPGSIVKYNIIYLFYTLLNNQYLQKKKID